MAAYVDRPNCRLFLEDGIIRFEGTNVVVHSKEEGEAYCEHLGPLSVTFTTGGRRVCTVDGRRMAVDEDSYLVSNLGQTVASPPERDSATETFLVGFWPGFAEEILRSVMLPSDRLLDDAKLAPVQPVEFFPQLYARDELDPVEVYLNCLAKWGCQSRVLGEGLDLLNCLFDV